MNYAGGGCTDWDFIILLRKVRQRAGKWGIWACFEAGKLARPLRGIGSLCCAGRY